MKRSLHFYKWFVAVVLLICSITTMSAQTKVTSLSQLKAGSVIKIYPKDRKGTSHYGESKYALACSGDGQSLTSYEKAGSGDEWTLEDAGDGFCYLKNNNGCYWAYQGITSSKSLECTMNKNSAVKISLTWDTKYSGVCFWNIKDGRGLNNLEGCNYMYNWWSTRDSYLEDANTTFDIAILSDGNGVAKNIVTSVSQLKAGIVIKIYPKNSDGTSHYGESKYALACSGDGQPLTSYEKAGSGDEWTLEDAGDGLCYLKNDKGCYWTYQGRSLDYLKCTMNKSSAVKISLTWDTKYSGVCFWNVKDNHGLNNLEGYNYIYNWFSDPDVYSRDANTTFDIALLKEGCGNDFSGGEQREIVLNGIKYRLNISKTAEVLRDDYSGDIVIPETVTYNNVTYRVTSLCYMCFSGCSSLTSINLPSSITSLGDYCFDRCSSLTSINLPSSITSLGDECFSNCSSLTSIILPSSITSLGDGCFSGCSSLTSINLPSSITSLGYHCFYHCYSLTSINLPSSITSLGDGCFYYCYSLTSINLPSSITSLGDYCFDRCSSLTSINLPSSITSLGYQCFYYCYSLASIELPSALTSLGEDCFKGCSLLTSMLCLTVEPPSCILSEYTNTHNTSVVNNTMRLYVPKESVEKYKQSAAWNSAKGIYPLYPTSSVLLAKEVSVNKAKPTKLEYTILPENAGTKELEWSSENPEVAIVDANGIVTGKKIGKTVITAKTKDGTDITASTTFTVLPLKVETMTFAEPLVSIARTKDKTIKLTLNSEEVDNKSMVWTSSDESVATVVQNPNSSYPLEAIVTAHKIGKATIKAEAQDGSGISATCEVEVTPLMVSDFSLLTASVVKTIPTQLEVKVSPAEADNKKLKWTSLTPDIATVTEDGMLTGLKMGTAQIKAEALDGSNISKTFNVEVTGLSVSSISLPTTPVSVVKTKTGKIKVVVEPLESDNQKLTWTSSRTDIATVDNEGVVTGKKVGTTRITASTTDGTNLKASVDVNIEPLKVETMTFAESSVSIVKTEDKTITLTLNSEEVDNKSMVWTSSDESVATVVQNMNAVYPLEAIVVAHKVGKATIKAEAQDGSGMSTTCEVEVTPLMVSDISLQTASIVKTIPTQLEANVSPAEADNKKLKWTSLTPDIATVTEDGMMTGLKMGTAKVKAETTDGSNLSCVFEVQVTGLPVSTISLPAESSIIKTESMKLECSILPLASDNQKLQWSSNATDIASVDESTGVITAHKVGDAVITATTTDGSGISASTTIHVTPLKVSQIEMPKDISLLYSLSKQIEVNIAPELADNKTLKWASEDESIATVTQEGVVKGVNVGTTNITATAMDGSGVSATCKVTVNPVTINLSTNTINLQKGSEYVEQTATILPENYEHKDVVWTTSGNGVASVDKDGHITANKPGVDTLRCSLSYDSHIYSECRVIVYEDNVVYVGGLYYLLKGTTEENREATVTSIYGGKNTSLDAKNVAQYYSGTINIPETIIYEGNKYTVRKVGSYAFNCQNELQSIYIPRTVTEVEPHAAIKAERLNRVNVADESELVNIGEEAFKWCTGLKRFTFDGTSLKMNSIDKAAFRECTALERFTWMGNTTVKTIGNSAFYDCPALEKVLWNGKSELKIIQDYAFFKCISLNNFEMPNTTLSVGNSSFRYNASLTNIHLSTSLNYIDEYAYGECGFSQITLPESLANIQAGAFINNDFLQEIILPERLQGLGSAAFENNSKLESVTFHTAIETMTIGNNAFNQCPILNKVYITNMNSFAQTNFNNAKANPANTSQHIYDANGKEIINVVLPKGTKYVNNNAFNGCAFIESVEMPATMDHVNDDIFVGCSALKDVYCYAEEVPEFIGVNNPASMDEVFQNATLHVPFGSESLYQKDTSWWGKFTKLLGCEPKPTAVVEKIDLSTLTVNVKAGENYNEQKLTIYPAEAANVRIKYSTADRKVADIDENGVIKGVAPGVTTIYYTANDGNGVTSECKVIVRNPEVEYVGDIYYLFDKAKKEATVTSIYGGKNKSLDAEKVAQVYTGTVSIPEQTTFNAVTYDVKKVGGYAFTCQNELQALRVGAFVEKIEDNAATKAMNLNRVIVANASQLVTVGKRSFMDCAGLQHVLFEGTTQYLDVIDTAAFKNCAKLEDVIWEGKSTLRLIGDSAFYCDSKLETVKWNDKCDLKIIDNYAFYKCSSLNHFIMPNSTLSVGKYAFRYDAGLTDIQLSTSLSIIYDYAFGECGFSQLILPESLKSMQAGAFINNSNLADITIPKKAEGIGAGAFENCSALESVTFKTHETKLTVDKNAFNHCAVLSKVNIDYLDDWAHINFQNAAANPASTAHRLYLNGEEIVDIELPVGTKYIGNNVFNGCSDIRTLKIPATVEHVNDNIIAGCSSLTDVYCYATKVPSFIGTEDPSSMNDVFRKATLHVIYGNEEAYKADAWWKRFCKIEGCNAPSDADKKVTSITISQTEATLKPNDTMQLEATVYPTDAANKKILWTSSNEDVVIVTDEGFVLAVAEGEADVTVASAENSEIKAVCHIKVEKEKEPEVPIVQIKFEESPVTIALGETKKLNVIFNPVNATNKELDWVSAQTSVVEVDKEGNILGVSEGKAIVSAKTKDGSNLTINCVVTVIPFTGISNITMGEVKLIVNNRHLKVEGLADHEVIQVVNSIGFTVYRGTDHEVDLNASGIYIVKMRGKTVKFNVK